MFLNLHEKRSLMKAIKEVLNVNFLQLTVNVKSFNV